MQKHDRPSGAEPNRAVAPARACAYAVVRRVFEQDAWADRALHGEARGCGSTRAISRWPPSSRFGTVQRVATLDHVIATLAPARPARSSTRRCWPRCGSGSSS